MIYNILKTTDLFKNDLKFRINRQEQISTVETIICSILFYICITGICIFTFIQQYRNEVPKIATRELVRDVNAFETVDKHKLDLILGSYYFNPLRGTISLLSHKNDTFFESTSKLDFREVTYFPTFIYKETLAAKMQNCSEEIYDKNRLISNAKCFEFQNNTFDFGGSVFSTGIEKNMRSRFNVDICDMKEVYNTGMSRLFPNSTIKTLIDSYEHKDICNVINTNVENTIIVSVLYSTDLLDIFHNKGYQTHFLSTYNNFAYQRFELVIDVMITKCTIETDFNRLYPIDPKIKNTYFEKDIKFTLREKKDRDNKLFVEVNYNVNNVIKATERSYVKFDEVLASAFALIEVAYLIIGYLAKWLSYNCVEYDLIKHLYYETPSNIISYKGFKDFSSSSRNSSISQNSMGEENKERNDMIKIDRVDNNNLKRIDENRHSLVQDQNKINQNNPFRQSLSTPISKFPKYYRGSVNPNNLSHGIIIVDEFNHNINHIDNINSNNKLNRKTLNNNGIENLNNRQIQNNTNNGGRIRESNIMENEIMVNNISNHIGPPKIINRETLSNQNVELKHKLAISDDLEYDSNVNMNKNHVIIDDNKIDDVVEINDEKSNKESRQSSFINSKSEISENSDNPIYDSITHPKNFGNFHIDEGAHRLDFYSGFLTCLKSTFGCCMFKKTKKNLIEREKVLQVLHRDLDIVIILKKLIECEFLTKNFYEQKFGKRNRRRSSFVYDNAFFYTNRNVNNPEDIFFTMDYKYFGSEVALFQKVDRKKTFKSLESFKYNK